MLLGVVEKMNGQTDSAKAQEVIKYDFSTSYFLISIMCGNYSFLTGTTVVCSELYKISNFFFLSDAIFSSSGIICLH